MLLSRKLLVAARVATAIFVSAAVAAGVLVSAPAAYAGSDDYPSQWKKPARDSMFDSWGEYNRECTSWVAWRLHGHNHFEMPFHGNANAWGGKAKKLGYTVDKTPAVGSVAWWDTSTRSHVAWVEAVYPNNTVEIEEYNIGGSGKYDQTTIPAASVSGYIHFQDLATSFADGAYITHDDKVYRMAGGAPIYVSTWAAYGKKPSGMTTQAQWDKLLAVPKDGTFLVGSTSKKIYQIVGGAPVYISSWDVVGGKKASVTVSDDAIAKAGATAPTSPWRHLHFYPVGPTFVVASPSKKVYKVENGVADPVADPATLAAKPTLTIGDDDIANAGADPSTSFGHLIGLIAAPTPTVTGGQVFGHRLVAHAGAIAPTDAKLTYTWLRNGIPIANEHKSTYHLYKSNIGKTISVQITATKSNFRTTVVVSAATAAIKKK